MRSGPPVGCLRPVRETCPNCRLRGSPADSRPYPRFAYLPDSLLAVFLSRRFLLRFVGFVVAGCCRLDVVKERLELVDGNPRLDDGFDAIEVFASIVLLSDD